MRSKKIFSFLLVSVLVTGWVFSGWPPIWQNPRIPFETQLAKAVATNMFLFWDGAVAPVGWSIVTTYDGKFSRGESAANFGVTGGNSTHTPTVSSVTLGAPSAGTAGGSTNTASSYTHTHGTLSVTVAPASNLPLHKGLKLIKYVGIPVSIPTGAIALFDASVPSGWTQQSALNGDMIMASSTTGTAYGSDTHTHALTSWTGLTTGASGTFTTAGATSNAGASATHTHTNPANSASDITASMTALPPYIQVVIGKANATTSLLTNAMIAMFDADPGSAWTIVSNSGGAFYQKLIQGATSYSASPSPAGATTHNHTAVTSANVSGAASAKTKDAGSGTVGAGPTHTHRLTANFSVGSDNMPPWFDIVYAKKNTNVAPNAPSQDSPANSATGVSVTPTFTMTATDPDPDHISYKVTIYSNSACTTVVGSAHDQSTNSTGWSGTDATCAASPTSCYNSGTQGSFALQSADALSFNTQYWWKASAKDPDASGTFTNSSTCNTFTTLTPVYSVSITPAGNIAYGFVNLSNSTTTVGSTYAKTATNDGNTAEKLNVKSSDATTGTTWTLASAVGTNQFKHEFSTTTGALWTVMPDSATYVTAVPSVAISGTAAFDFRLTAPSSSSDYQQKSITITVQAVAP